MSGAFLDAASIALPPIGARIAAFIGKGRLPFGRSLEALAIFRELRKRARVNILKPVIGV